MRIGFSCLTESRRTGCRNSQALFSSKLDDLGGVGDGVVEGAGGAALPAHHLARIEPQATADAFFVHGVGMAGEDGLIT